MNTVVKPLLRVKIQETEIPLQSACPDEAVMPVEVADAQFDLSSAGYRVIMNCWNQQIPSTKKSPNRLSTIL